MQNPFTSRQQGADRADRRTLRPLGPFPPGNIAPARHHMAASWRRLVLLGLVTLLPSHGGAAGSCSIVDGACICEDGSGNEWDVTELTAGAGSGASQVVATGACSGSYW